MNIPDQMTARAERLYDEAYKCIIAGDYPGFADLLAPNCVLNLSYASNLRLNELQI